MTDFWAAIGLMLALEGTLYALAPGGIKKMMRSALELPDGQLRLFGLAVLAAGVFVVWLVRG